MEMDIITIPVEMPLMVWGEKVDYISVRTDDPAKEDDEDFWNGEFRQHLANAVKILGESSKYESLLTAVAIDDKDIELDYLSSVTLSFIGSKVWYDYIFEAGKLIGNFDVHLKATPDGKMEFVEMT